MDAPAINPLCDKDGVPMSRAEILIEEPGTAEILPAYVCDSKNCDRCYNEGTGYFDFVGGRPNLDHRQRLCETDALPMFLEIVSSDETEIWRCPGCTGIDVRSGR